MRAVQDRFTRRSIWGSALLVALWAALCSCQESEGPRALIVVAAYDGQTGKTGQTSAQEELSSKLAAFSKQHGRNARALSVEASPDALELASRGEADVALLAESTPIDAFVAAEHGRDMGFCALGGKRLRVLSVNTKQHPKADAQGEALAQFLAGNNKTSAGSP